MNHEGLSIGSPLPRFGELPDVSGKSYSSKDFAEAKALVIVFSCNHCPYVQAYEERMIALQQDYADKGVRLVAINANETLHHPEDNFDEMVKRAEAKGFNFPYLRDEDQSTAAAFGATHTPEFFVFAVLPGGSEQLLQYHGKMDDSYQDASGVRERYILDAVEAILEDRRVARPETHSIGCTIKWKR
ncbi:MAG: thioredoxin family protein [Bacteroidota bacterium]